MKKIANIFCLILPFLLLSCEIDDFEYGVRPESLRNFQLVTPKADASLMLNAAEPNEPVVIEWEPSRSGLNSEVEYTWLVDEQDGDFSDPLISLPSDNDGKATKITLTQQQIDQALASAGIPNEGTAQVKWTVQATNPTYSKLAPNAFNISIKRFAEGVSRFSLATPISGSKITLVESSPDRPVQIKWAKPSTAKGSELKYEWLASTTNNFEAPALTIPSDNGGKDTVLTLTHQQIDEALAGLSVARASTVELYWTVKATAGGFVQYANEPNIIRLTRFGAAVEVTFKLNNYAAVPAGYDVYMAGEFQKLGVAEGNWQQPGTNPDLKLEKDGDVYKTTLVVPLTEEDFTMEYKYFLVPTGQSSWSYGEQAFSIDGCGPADNRKYTFRSSFTEDQTVESTVITWEGSCYKAADPRAHIVVTVPTNTPMDKDVYITGSLGFLNWVQPGQAAGMKMKKVEGTNKYEIYLPLTVNQEVEFKFFLATTNAPDWNGGEEKFNASNTGCESAANRKFTFTGSNSVNATVVSWQGYCPY